MKIIFVSSYGGHYVQLKEIASLIDERHIKKMVCTSACNDYDSINILNDYNIKSLYKSLWDLLKVVKFLKNEKPDLVISTGAAPGFMFLILSKFCGIKTIWIDSMANSRRLSLSGKVGRFIFTQTYTQWEEVSSLYKNVNYIGRLL